MNFLIGGLTGVIATTLILPFDCIKIQMQLKSESGEKRIGLISTIKDIYVKNNRSIKPFYKGIDSALIRQIIINSVGLGLFYQINDNIVKEKGRRPTLTELTFAGFAGGAVASLAANPVDLMLIRMQADIHLKPEERRNYGNVFQGLYKTVSEEGLLSLWKGSIPSILKAISLNFGTFTFYEQFKYLLSDTIVNPKTLSLICSIMITFTGTTLSLPFDNIKTKLQKQKRNHIGEMPYSGVIDCLKKSIKNEGFPKLWVGFQSYYLRFSQNAVLTIFINERLRIYLNKNKL